MAGDQALAALQTLLVQSGSAQAAISNQLAGQQLLLCAPVPGVWAGFQHAVLPAEAIKAKRQRLEREV